MNVRELRAQLDKLESEWTDLDKKHLGEFGAQGIYVDAFRPEGGYGGIALAKLPYYDAQFGVMIFGQEVEPTPDKT